VNGIPCLVIIDNNGNKLSADAVGPIWQCEAAKTKTHSGVGCDGCSGAVVGIRYKCTVCPDFDFSEKCKAEKQHDHAFKEIKFDESMNYAGVFEKWAKEYGQK